MRDVHDMGSEALLMVATMTGMRRLVRAAPAKPRETAPAPPPAEEPPMSRQQRRARERAERKAGRSA